MTAFFIGTIVQFRQDPKRKRDHITKKQSVVS
jgi:hypothetical protein